MQGKTVYVVEDEPLWREELAGELGRTGFEVKDFPSVDDALKHMGWREDSPKLSVNLPDMIITDNDTGSRHNGLDLLRAAREAGIPRMLISGTASMKAVIEAGGKETAHFYKPCFSEQVADKAQEMLSPQHVRRP